MRKILASVLTVLTTVGVVAVAAPAHAKTIKCRTVVTYSERAQRTTARVVSLNKTGTQAKVHSVIFEYSDGDGWWTMTYDNGYGPVMTTPGYSYAATAWQAGTRCARGGVTFAG